MRLLNLIKTYWLACTALILTVITPFLLLPLTTVPHVVPGKVLPLPLTTVLHVPSKVLFLPLTIMPGKDKTMHMIAYAALIFPAGLRRPTHIQSIFLLFLLYSGMIELLQPYVNRGGEWLDLAANTVGLACGLLLAELLRRLSDRRA